jgi:LruC domain-containing protein
MYTAYNLAMKKIFSFVFLTLILTSCEKEVDSINLPMVEQSEGASTLTVPSSFDFSTTQPIEIEINVKDLQGNPFPNSKIYIYDKSMEDGGKLLFSGTTNSYGSFASQFEIPSFLRNVFVRVNRVGMVNEVFLQINSNRISHTFGGELIPNTGSNKNMKLAHAPIHLNGKYYYLSTFNAQGVPANLEPVNDVIDASFISEVIALLPERVPMDLGLIDPSFDDEIHLTQDTEISLTFLHEGAGYKNTLAFFKYNTSNPPATKADVDSIFIIFPNSSAQGSDGGLQAGNRVKLGSFKAGTSLGWILLQNAWNSGSQQTNTSSINWFSQPSFNSNNGANGTAGPSAATSQHHVALIDRNRQRIVLGFEDINRDNIGSDLDFNDALFYVSASNYAAISGANLPNLGTPLDTDGDGVVDTDDDYPNDPAKANNNFAYGSLAFEDLWPYQGDYDFNDLVVDYSTNLISNASNELVEIELEYNFIASGAYRNNGFGVQIDGLLPSDISSSTAPQLYGNYIQLNGNNTEAGQSSAVFIITDQVKERMGVSRSTFVNTVQGDTEFPSVVVSNRIVLTHPVPMSQVGAAPFNPFLISDGNRGQEVHLKNYLPTDLADASHFNEGADASELAQGRSYSTESGLPWAIHLSGLNTFAYPQEQVAITEAYHYFASWAQSGGIQFQDWYLNETYNVEGGKIYYTSNQQ